MKGLFGTTFTLEAQKTSMSGKKTLFTSLYNLLILINLIVFHTVVNMYVERYSGLEYILSYQTQ